MAGYLRDLANGVRSDSLGTGVGVAFIWWTGIKDYHLSKWLIENDSPAAELNALARAATESLTVDSLLTLKAGALLFFTAVVLIARHRNRTVSRRLLQLGICVSTGLSAWWSIALWPLT